MNWHDEIYRSSKISDSVMGLTEEQKLRMEQKRAEALAKMKSKSTSGHIQSTNQMIKATTDLSKS